jgi:hypothetical protein
MVNRNCPKRTAFVNSAILSFKRGGNISERKITLTYAFQRCITRKKILVGIRVNLVETNTIFDEKKGLGRPRNLIQSFEQILIEKECQMQLISSIN